MVPAEQCISNGFSCIQSAYHTPTEVVRIEAEDRFKGGDRAPYYIMDRRASLKHLKVGEVHSSISFYFIGEYSGIPISRTLDFSITVQLLEAGQFEEK